MKATLKQVYTKTLNHRNVGCPQSAEIKPFDKYGLPISRNTKTDTILLKNYLDNLPPDVRVGSFLKEVQRRTGASVAARLELWVAGHKIDGRMSLANLR